MLTLSHTKTAKAESPNSQTALERVLDAKRPRTKLGRFAARFGANERGVAAIEFALIAPVLLFLYFGLCEISLLIEADRSVSQAASVIGDLAAQDPVATPQMVQNYINASMAILGADYQDAAQLNVELYSFEATMEVPASGGAPERTVSKVGTAKYTTAKAPTWPEDFDGDDIEERLLAAGSGIVVARVSFQYDSPLGFFVQDTELRETFMLKPRVSNIVQFDNGSSNPDETKRYNMSCRLSGATPPEVACSAAAPDP